jgi:hypothetical protein
VLVFRRFVVGFHTAEARGWRPIFFRTPLRGKPQILTYPEVVFGLPFLEQRRSANPTCCFIELPPSFIEFPAGVLYPMLRLLS